MGILECGCNTNDLIKSLVVHKCAENFNESENHISQFNETCKTVSSAPRQKLNKVIDYEIGEVLICRKCINLNKAHVKFQVSFNHTIAKTEGVFTVENILTGEMQHIGDRIIKDSFIFTYYAAFHSSQGDSINGKVCIFD